MLGRLNVFSFSWFFRNADNYGFFFYFLARLEFLFWREGYARVLRRWLYFVDFFDLGGYLGIVWIVV